MNNINIIGNLTADPIKGDSEDGTTVAFFTVAVNRIGSDKADFFHCKAKDKQADNLLKYKKRGDKLGVSGWMFSYPQKGAEVNGRPVMLWMIAAIGIDYCDSRRGEQQEQQPKQEEPPAGNQNQGADQSASGFRRRR